MNPKKTTAGAVFAALGKALCYLFLFLLCQILVTALYTVAAMLYARFHPALSIDPVTLTMSCSDQISLFSGVAALVLLAAFFLLRQRNPLRESGIRLTRGRHVLTALGITPLLYVAVSFALSLLPEAWMDAYNEASAALNQTGIIMVVATVVMAPIVEEVVFRGLILSRLNRVMPGWLAVLLSAAAFGLCHGQAVWMAYAFVLGALFGFLTLRARSIWPSLIAHFLFNGIGQLGVYLPQTEAVSMVFVVTLAAAGVTLCIIALLVRIFRPVKAT